MIRGIFVTGLAAVAVLSCTAGEDASQAAWGEIEHAMSGDMEHRLQGLEAIATISNTNQRAVQMAESALKDHEAEVRVAAAKALADMKATQAAPALKAALDDTNEVAFAAAKALCAMGDPDGRDVLVAVLAGERKDTPGMLTKTVREARKKMHHPEGVLLSGAGAGVGTIVPGAGAGVATVKGAVKLRGGGDQASAADALAKDPEPYAVSLLEWALTDDSWEVRAAAAKALGERGNADTVPKLADAMNQNKRAAVRTMAAAAIIRIDDRLGTSASIGQ